MGDRGRQSIRLFLTEAVERGIISHDVPVDFVQ
jgi:hypothetical protein